MPKDPDDIRQIKANFRAGPWLAFQHQIPDMLAWVRRLDEYAGRDPAKWPKISAQIREDPRFKRSLLQKGGVPRYLAPLGGRIFHSLASGCRRVNAIGANRSAKTMSGAIAASCFAHGAPSTLGLPVPKPPVQVWCCFPDWVNHGQPITKKYMDWALGTAGVTFKKAERLYLVCSHILENEGVACKKCEAPSEVYLKSYDSGSEKHQGGAPALIWNDEAPPQDIYEEHSARIGGEHPLIILQTLTPLRPAAWMYSEIYQPWLDEGEPENTAFLGSKMVENPFLTEEDIESVRKAYAHDPQQLEVRMEGTWAMTSGAVYPMLDAKVHVIDDFPIPGVHYWPSDEPDERGVLEMAWTLYRFIDPGIRNPTAVLWCAVDPYGRCWIYREAYLTNMSIPEVCRAIGMAETVHEHRPRFPDRTDGFNRNVVDPAAAQRDLVTGTARNLEYAKNGLVCLKGNNDREYGIDRMKQAFSFEMDAEGNFRVEPKYRFFRSCPETWKQHRKYSWLPHNPNSPRGPRDDAQKKEDHGPDALRYGDASYGGPKFVPPIETVTEEYVPEDAKTGY